MVRNRVDVLRPLARLLVDAALDRSDRATVSATTTCPPVDVVGAGSHHRVLPAIHRVASRVPDLELPWRAAIASARQIQLVHHLRVLHDLKLAAAALDDAGVGWCVLKGPALAQTVWPAPDMRQFQDLDILADPRRAQDALEILLQAGFTLVDRNWVALERSARAELALRGPTGTAVDLHWNVVVASGARRQFSIDAVEMLDRTVPRGVGNGVQARVLDPVDTVHHLLVHAGLDGAHKLMWLADILYATRQDGFSWAALDARTRASRTHLLATAVLRRVQGVLGLEIPAPWGSDGPGGDAWVRLVTSRDARIPFPGLPGDPHLGGSLYSGTAPTWYESALGGVRDRARSRRYGRRGDAEEFEVSVLDEDVPDPDARRRYFERVLADASTP